MNGEGPAFVDTNVLVYAYDKNESVRQAIAEKLIGQLVDDDRIRLSTQVLQEFYVIMTRKIEEPWEPAETLTLLDDFSAWPVVAVDYGMIRDAVLLSVDAVISFWEALILVAANRSGAVTVFTEDLNHGQRILGIEVFNPFREPRSGQSLQDAGHEEDGSEPG